MAKGTNAIVLVTLQLVQWASVGLANSYISSFSDTGCTQLLAEWGTSSIHLRLIV